MLVYVLNQEKLISFTLPSTVSGSYWVKDKDKYNNEIEKY